MSDEDEGFIPFTSSAEQWKKLKPFARTMRHDPTPAEQRLWESLRGRRLSGTKFRRQHAVEGFIVDFMCVESKLIIEVDGNIHDDLTQKTYDEARQQQLEARGFRVPRFRNQEIFETLEDVLETIWKALTLP